MASRAPLDTTFAIPWLGRKRPPGLRYRRAVTPLTAGTLRERIDAHPRARLAHLPTPLQPMERLTEALGGPPLWIKRDDCTGLATGGNKARKLEYLLGRARAEALDHVITFGALQSNHARQTAAACARLGLGCDLILVRRVPRTDPDYASSGNVLLDRVLGATLHAVDDDAEAARVLARRLGELEAAGRRVGVVPPGGSNATGTLGYVRAALELALQWTALGIEPASLWLACSTTGTQAGLVVGLTALGATTRVEGADVYAGDADAQQTALRALAEQTASALDLTPPGDDRLHVDAGHAGEGYGIPDDAALEAIELVARHEGILLDPVYTGKAMAALIDAIRIGRADRDAGPIVFLHTGGTAGLFAYGRALTRRGAPGP